MAEWSKAADCNPVIHRFESGFTLQFKQRDFSECVLVNAAVSKTVTLIGLSGSNPDTRATFWVCMQVVNASGL